MSDLILHHYPLSPFSEKVRLILGFKRLAWRSVLIPMVMPKPDVVALTGGYRKTPILQIGADVWCDTAAIARALDARQPSPPLFPAEAPLAGIVAQFADSVLFAAAAAWAFQPAAAGAMMPGATPETLKAFAVDRSAAGFRRMPLAEAGAQLRAHLAALDAQLAQGGPWLFGARACVADFSVAHTLWFIRRARPVVGILAPFGHLTAWLDRVCAIGEGDATPLDSGDALAIAAAAGGHAATAVADGQGFAAGDAVIVAATDWATDTVAGTLVGLTPVEVVLRRTDPRAGTVHVHFPRIGFQIKKETSA